MKLKRIYRIIILCTAVILFISPPTLASKNKKKGYTVSARSVIFSDSTKIKRLYGKDVHKRVLPASTAKVMTALIVLEELPLKRIITVSKTATLAPASKLYFKPGERFKVADLLYAILLKSANDASVALAEAVAGSEQNFVRMMNKRAKQLGANHTKFANSSGLPTKKVKQYTTAYDMYLIFRQALKHKIFRKAIKTKYKTIYSRKGKKRGRKFSFKSHNKILFNKWRRKIYGKTGYTKAAKTCFIGTIQKGSSTLIIAVFGCTRRWQDIKHIVSQYGGIRL